MLAASAQRQFLALTPTPSDALRRSMPLEWWLLFSCGLGATLLMAWRSQVGGDQQEMLQLGWQLLANGDWIQHGMRTSAGGVSPGGFTGLLIALPLYFWRDYRSPAVFTVMLHAAAFMLLAYSLRDSLSRTGQWLLLLLVWLNPWRMYFSAHIWDPNLMFVAAVVHLVTAQRMAVRDAPLATALHVINIGLALQVHTSAAVLAFATLLLVWKRLIHIHWPAAAAGVAALAVAYAPWATTIVHDRDLLPGNQGFLLHNLLTVSPLVRGALYWLRLPSLSLDLRTEDFDFQGMVGTHVGAALVVLTVLVTALAQVTLIPCAWIQWRFYRRRWRFWRLAAPGPSRPRAWLRAYVLAFSAAALFCFAISPTTVMAWQVFIALPAAALAGLMTADALLRTRLRTAVLKAIPAWCVLAFAVTIAQAFGAPMYRCGGRHVATYDEMLQDLHASRACIAERPLALRHLPDQPKRG